MYSILATTKSSWRNRKQQCSKFGVQNWFIYDWIFYKNCYCFCHIAIENFIGYADICHCSVPWNYSTQVRGHSTTMWNKFYSILTPSPVNSYSVVSIKRTGLLNYFEVFVPPWSFFSCTKWNFCSTLIFFSCTK